MLLPSRRVMQWFSVRVLTVASAILLIAGCDSDFPLEGRQFEITAVDGKALLSGSRATIRFDKDFVRGFAGCNQYNANLTAGSRNLSIHNLTMTEIGCNPPELRRQEQLILAALQGVRSYEAGSSILLRGSNELTLKPGAQEGRSSK